MAKNGSWCRCILLKIFGTKQGSNPHEIHRIISIIYLYCKSLQIENLCICETNIVHNTLVAEIEDLISFSVAQKLSQPIEHSVAKTFIELWLQFLSLWGCFRVLQLEEKGFSALDSLRHCRGSWKLHINLVVLADTSTDAFDWWFCGNCWVITASIRMSGTVYQVCF